MVPTMPKVLTTLCACQGSLVSFNICAAPAMADDMKSAGSEVLVSCHTGTAVFEISTAVYPASGTPSTAETKELTGSPNSAAAPAHGGAMARIHDPMQIGRTSGTGTKE